MKMPWKRRRSHENHEDEEKKQNQSFGSFYTISSILTIANWSRVFSAQFLSNACTYSLKTPSPTPNVCKLFNAKPPKPPHPNKCQKRCEDHPNKVGLSLIASIPNQLMAMPKIELDDSWKAKSNENIVQRHQFVVIDLESDSSVTRSVPTNVACAKKKSEEGIFIISPPASVSYGYGNFYPPSIFMSYCHFCDKRLTHDDDVYIYRGEKAFCSEECRTEEIFLEGVILDEENQEIIKGIM